MPKPLFSQQRGPVLESRHPGFLALLAWRNTAGKAHWAIGGAFATVVLGTMLGRMELGRHWPVDVTGGLVVGLIALRIITLLHRNPGVQDSRTEVTRLSPANELAGSVARVARSVKTFTGLVRMRRAASDKPLNA